MRSIAWLPSEHHVRGVVESCGAATGILPGLRIHSCGGCPSSPERVLHILLQIAAYFSRIQILSANLALARRTNMSITSAKLQLQITWAKVNFITVASLFTPKNPHVDLLSHGGQKTTYSIRITYILLLDNSLQLLDRSSQSIHS